MKVRNLLLAGLAVAAMTACSNNDEIVDNGIQNLTGEQANMKLLFSFNENGNTRAASEGTPTAGTELEYGATKITAVLDYSDGRPRVIMPGLTLQKDENSQIAVATTEEFTVTAGSNVKLYAFINPTGLTIDQTTDLNKLAVGEHTSFTGKTTLAYIDNSVAKGGDFLMSGQTVVETIKAGEIVTAQIDVNRVAAKLDEKTSNGTLFTITNPGLIFEGELEGTTLGVKLLNHSYSNLATNSYVLPQATTYETYLQKYIAKGTAATDDSYRWNATGATYCLENSSAANPTRVHYQAKVYFGEKEATETFYIRAMYVGDADGTYENRVYKNWKALKTAYPSTTWDDSKKDDDAYLKANGIKKYNAGICYYEAPIEHATAGAKIIRNNWYELTVSEVSKLGTPTPVEESEDTPTKLIIKANIQPWKVQINNIKL